MHYVPFFRLLSVSAVLLVALAPTARAWPLLHWLWRQLETKRNFDTISHIYNLTVYPHQVPIILGGANAVPDGLFSHKVRGRVYPVGNFTSFEDSIEYFFALSPLPQGNAVSAAITDYKITEFTSGCKNVASSVVYLYTSVVKPGCKDHGKALPPLKQVSRQPVLQQSLRDYAKRRWWRRYPGEPATMTGGTLQPSNYSVRPANLIKF